MTAFQPMVWPTRITMETMVDRRSRLPNETLGDFKDFFGMAQCIVEPHITNEIKDWVETTEHSVIPFVRGLGGMGKNILHVALYDANDYVMFQRLFGHLVVDK